MREGDTLYAKDMRAFIAIELPKNIKDALTHLQGQLKLCGADVKWVEPRNIHLTLKFLGEVDEVKIKRIAEIMEDITLDKRPFQIRICCAGGFPNTTFPRVIWAGIDKGDGETKEIAGELQGRIASLGIPKEERAFSSHVTLGRTKSQLNRERLAKVLGELAEGLRGIDFPEFCVTKITLFKSTLTPRGPTYENLKEANLKAT